MNLLLRRNIAKNKLSYHAHAFIDVNVIAYIVVSGQSPTNGAASLLFLFHLSIKGIWLKITEENNKKIK